MEDKLRQMEDEMNRFEAEIGGQLVTPMMRPVIGANTYSQVARQLEQHDIPGPVVASAPPSLTFPPIMGFPPPPPPPPPPPMLIPPQVARQGTVPITTYSSPAQINNPYSSNVDLSSTPKTYESQSSGSMIHPEIIEQIINTKIPEEESKRKLKPKGVSTAAELAISQGKASSIMANASAEETHPKGKGKKNKKIIRMAGGQTWEDQSLLEWDDDDFRIFCGDLGNDVTDEMLVRVFGKYPSFQKAKVVRDKRTNKTKGFGFVSFKDPQDFIKAMKEMNGDWKRDTKYGFGAYYYANHDVYEGGWRKNFRHGLGTYVYEATGTKFMGTWINDRMQGPGQLVHPRHRFHGSWELNLPYGRGCFVFENASMQHGHYVHTKDPDQRENEGATDPESEVKTDEEMSDDGNKADVTKPPPTEVPRPLKRGILPIWRARYVTPYNPDLLPPVPVLIKDEVSEDSWSDKCEEDDVWSDKEEYLKYPEVEYDGEYEDNYYDKHSPYEPVTPDFDE